MAAVVIAAAVIAAGALVAPVHAASLDNLQIGGPWGTPTATDATAVWWNPAGIASGKGTRLMLELEPTWASFNYSRTDPNGGNDAYTLTGAVPYAGVSSDLTVPGLGVGLALAIPFVRGGTETVDPGPGRYAMRVGNSRAVFILLGGGYNILDKIALGAAVAYVKSEWTAKVDTDTLPDLRQALIDEGQEPTYTDADLENPRYAATTDFSTLSDDTMTFSGGIRVTPLTNLAVGVTYIHGATVNNEGTVDITFDCPPDEDTMGSYGADSLGLCHTVIPAKASVGYSLPNRVHGGIMWEPTPAVRLEVMGGWVGWSQYKDFTIKVRDAEVTKEKAEPMVEQERLWARDNIDTGWVGLDAKGHVGWRWTFGARILYDASAVPTNALSTNNWDGDSVDLAVLAAFKPIRPLEIGVSYEHDFVADRTTTDSVYGMTIDGTPKADRYFYAHGNGKYSGSIDRLGISLRAYFK